MMGHKKREFAKFAERQRRPVDPMLLLAAGLPSRLKRLFMGAVVSEWGGSSVSDHPGGLALRRMESVDIYQSDWGDIRKNP